MIYQIAKIKFTCTCELSEKCTLVAFSIPFALVTPPQTYTLLLGVKSGTIPSMKDTFDYFETNTDTYCNNRRQSLQN